MKTNITRRNAAGRLLGVGATAVTLELGNSVRAAEPWPEFSFLIVTDTHLGYKDSNGAQRQWEKTAKELKEASGDLVLHLGDVINAGRVDLYPAYKTIRDSIGKKVHEIPGNHDPLSDFEKHLQKADRSFDHKGVRFVMWNNSRRDSHDGFVTPKQLDWLEEELQKAADRRLRVIICAHVPFHSNRPPDRAWYVKPANGQTRYYELVDQHKDRILATFHGHFHNGIRGWDDRKPVHEILMPSALYNQKRNLMEKGAPGYHLAETRAGYVIASLGNGKLELQYKVTGDDGPPSTKTLENKTG